MDWTLHESYACCERAARSAASNFYFAFYLLPRAKRRAMCALYAFLRKTDDLGDGDAPRSMRQAALNDWRSSLEAAWDNEFRDPILPALVDMARRYDVPREYLSAAIDGVQMDLDGTTYETFDDLRRYCYRVASVVGLACIHIWGFRDRRAIEPATECGMAFQLTNILRDLKEDAAAGRIYLPREDLRRFGYDPAQLASGVTNDRFRKLMAFEIDRAESLYAAAAGLRDFLSADGRRVFGAMFATYRSLLREIKSRHGEILNRRIALGRFRKLGIFARSTLPWPV